MYAILDGAPALLSAAGVDGATAGPQLALRSAALARLQVAFPAVADAVPTWLDLVTGAVQASVEAVDHAPTLQSPSDALLPLATQGNVLVLADVVAQ